MDNHIYKIDELFKVAESLHKDCENEAVELARTRREIGYVSNIKCLKIQGCIDDIAIQVAKIDKDDFQTMLIKSFGNDSYSIVLKVILLLYGFSEDNRYSFTDIETIFNSPDFLCKYKSYDYLINNQVVFLKAMHLISTRQSHFIVTETQPLLVSFLIEWIDSLITLWKYMLKVN